MTKAKKPRVIEGWTCANPISTDRSSVAPQHRIEFCSKTQHTECSRKKECEMFRPQCETARNRMGGTPELDCFFYIGEPEDSPARFELMANRDMAISETLTKYWGQCHPVRVTAEELA